MWGLWIADDDAQSRSRLAQLFMDEGYDVVATDSAAHVIEGILKNVARVLILGREVDGLSAAELLPILKSCQAKLAVIVATEETPLLEERRLRRLGIFYHLLKPLRTEDREEIRQVVECAFENLGLRPAPRQAVRA